MRDTTEIQRVRGTNDVLPGERSAMMVIEKALETVFEGSGYQPIEVPIIESTDLFLKKSGEEIIARLFAFDYHNRKICLRPEFTASMIRAYVNSMQTFPLPLRLYCKGPAFRYEKPQRGRYRQFTQMGIELIGSDSSAADGEVIYLACKGLDALGLRNYQVVIGHLGIVWELLRRLGLDERLAAYLVESLDRLGKPGHSREGILQRLMELYPSLVRGNEHRGQGALIAQGPDPLNSTLGRYLETVGADEAKALVETILRTMSPGLADGSRTPSEIAERLIGKIRQRDQTELIERALDLIEELKRAKGQPPAIFQDIRRMLGQYGLEPAAAEGLEAVWQMLQDLGIEKEKVTIDLGLGRGLQYYTGFVFEIYHRSLGAESQIAGGGRYDDLICLLGGRDRVPACGFSYGLERLKLALESEGASPIPGTASDVLVVAVESAQRGCAALLCELFRQWGLVAQLDVREGGLKTALKYAARSKIPFVAIVGPEEVATATVIIRDMERGQEGKVATQELERGLGGLDG